MPLKTFLNLSEQRRKEIIGVCLEEFARNSYESASLTRIIKKLGLAKGSFYRYFENKKDLYIYLVDLSRRINREQTIKYFEDPELDFFQAMVRSFIGAIHQESQYPYYLQFSFRVSMERKYAIFGELVAEYRQEKDDILEKLIRYHQEQGDVRQDIEIKKIIQWINYTVLGIREYLFLKYYSDDQTRHSSALEGIPEDELEEDLTEFSRMLRSGMETKP